MRVSSSEGPTEAERLTGTPAPRRVRVQFENRLELEIFHRRIADLLAASTTPIRRSAFQMLDIALDGRDHIVEVVFVDRG